MKQAQGIVMVPDQIKVADDRGHVAGWAVHTHDHSRHALGTVIPPEGVSIDGWADLPEWITSDDELMDTIRLEASLGQTEHVIRIQRGADGALIIL